MKNSFLLILLCQIIISCNSNILSKYIENEMIEEFYSLPFETIKNLKNEDSYFVIKYNNHEKIIDYPNLENTFFLFLFDEDSISIQGFNKLIEFNKLIISSEIVPELTNENLAKYKTEIFKPFTTENDEIVKMEKADITEYYFNFKGSIFSKKINEFDLESYDSMKNINAENNLSLSFLDFDQSLKIVLYLYFLELEKKNESDYNYKRSFKQ